tara:strand:- start:395 stop:727 length:333 start_codon:yes stop_codon:yes gene_type:complete
MTSKDEKKYKKIIHYDVPKKHADLKIRWQYDDMKQSEFFRLLTDAYLEQDERILSLVEEYKQANKKQNKEKRRKTKKMYEQSKEVETKFALKNNEVESIFDLLEKEHPDL